jgi:transketolase
VLTRQKLPVIDPNRFASAENAKRGGYVLADSADKNPDVILMATGSEVSLILSAYEKLSADGIKARAVSLLSWEIFDEQPEEYRHEVLPPSVRARIAVEAASEFGWRQYVGDHGLIIAMKSFGASAPAEVNMEKFGFTPDNVVAKAKSLLNAKTQ